MRWSRLFPAYAPLYPRNKKPALEGGFFKFGQSLAGSTLTGFEPLVDLVDDVVAAPAADKLVVAMPAHQRT